MQPALASPRRAMEGYACPPPQGLRRQALDLSALARQVMDELREKKVVTFQGKQGWWTLKSAVMPYLTPIHGLECLRKFVSALPK